ncbi:Outer membrane receptor proteins, mostly Fe transport [Pseudarcicella hirudinis]|uniref:Outer membrane receptor proteins, mostly Fe transport n=1 Tax=Pseudarcicella hirudinis TaxID=1079859 RepID=A0A1I5VX53_9BACT|nr:TonB-dependent receptor [Pseudarcicella hirudinis]SFQ12031.1 Outer membrane receptor proteins, mostly Fe transport [Pseudarcicella hirudinis]
MKSNFTILRFSTITVLILLIGITSFAQTKISGKVSDASTKESLVGVSISVKGKVVGTITDQKGNFSLTTVTPVPFKIGVTIVGYAPQEFTITDSKSDLNIQMVEQSVMGQEVVVSASRVEENIMKSAASIEKMDIRAIRETPSVNFYDALANIKGVEMSTQSLTFKSVNTRGFNSNGNVRMVQLMDGMDNQAPGLNFSVGNIVGMSELDVESVELIPGAASALYGPNAINGILLMNSKSPFLYQGLSASVKTGIMNESNRSTATTNFNDISVRYAKAFNNKFAFKVNFSYLGAKDWEATDYRDGYNLSNSLFANPNRATNPNQGYDGVNTYGDETASDLPIGAGGSNVRVSRTGYYEKDLVDYNTRSLKFNASLHYRLTEKVEAIIQGNYGNGTSVYTGQDRYSLKNFDLGQYKIELKGDNFFLRAYTTQERSGDSYAAGTLGQLVNEAYNPSVIRNASGAVIGGWFAEYATAFAGGVPGVTGGNPAAARAFADRNRLVPGTQQFDDAVNAIKKKPIPNGAGFNDKTNLYHYEGMYNFKNSVKFAEIIVGGNYRVYSLNSEGTLFADKDGRSISIKEWGAYGQISKSFFSDVLKLSASARYDKNENFDGQFTPRVSAVISPNPEQNFRVSYQTGFRIPTTQNQYIDLKTPQAYLIGGLPEFTNRFNSATNPAFTRNTFLSAVADITAQVTALGTQLGNSLAQEFGANPGAFFQKYGITPTSDPAAIQAAIKNLATQQATAQTPQIAAGVLASGKYQPYQQKTFKPEKVRTIELGYKGLLTPKLFLDAYYYHNTYKDFTYQEIVLQSTSGSPLGLLNTGTRQVYAFPATSEGETTSEGWGIGLDYRLDKGYNVGFNVSKNSLNGFDNNILNSGGRAEFNTPNYRLNASLGNRNIGGSGFGFNVTWRYQEGFVWQSGFTAAWSATDTNIPSFNTLDAQISKKLTGIKSILKIGGTNILGKSYTTSFGNPSVGSMFYVGLTFDELLNK